MEILLKLPEHEVKNIMHSAEAKDEEKRRFLIALRNLKAYTGNITKKGLKIFFSVFKLIFTFFPRVIFDLLFLFLIII